VSRRPMPSRRHHAGRTPPWWASGLLVGSVMVTVIGGATPAMAGTAHATNATHAAHATNATSGAPVARPSRPGAAVRVAAFATEPVVLTGGDFPDWTSGPEVTARPPQAPTDYSVYNSQGTLLAPLGLQSDCFQANPQPDVNGQVDKQNGDHSCFQGSDLPVRTVLKGVPAQSLLGYRWDSASHRFVQIPFQVDTKWQHYLTNNASGFAFYSGADQMLTYTFDSEPFLLTSNPKFDPSNPANVCQAEGPGGTAPDATTTPDPNQSLINTDEMAFMARDAGTRAPASAALPAGIVSANQVRLVDPTSGAVRYAYVMESAMGSNGQPQVAPAYTAANSPYVKYTPDRNADMYAYSQSNYSDYGNAPVGPVCAVGPNGTPVPVIGQGFQYNASNQIVLDPSTYVQRRTLDIASVSTPRYKFQYGDPATSLAGRWIMDGLAVSPDNGGLTKGDYGASLIDRFKGRAFQQAPGGDTPCCGYEDEQVNWNGSSITMGIKQGPVRDIRVTWGSDSGTNVTRTDFFYADSVDHQYNLRVHPIPPLDGIYTQWNMQAGSVNTYYNPYNPKGVPVTGINPVLYGDTHDFVGPSGVSTSSNDKLGRQEQSLNGGQPLSVGSPNKNNCGAAVPGVSVPEVGSPDSCIYGSFNLPDATFSGLAPELLNWEELTGPAGTMVEKWSVDQSSDPSPGGAQGVVETVPYYVDDSCFDDGTGNSPGPQVDPRNIDPTTWGFADQNGKPVAVSPAPSAGQRYSGTVTDDGTTYDGSTSYNRRCWNHNANGTPYNIPGTATYDASKPAQAQDPTPDQHFGPQGDVRYFEGDIATHGLHVLFTSDSDNADLATAVDEIDSYDNQVILPPNQKNVGLAFSQQFVTPVQSVVTPFGASGLAVPQPYVAGSGVPSSPVSGHAGTGSSNPGASDSLVPAAAGPAAPKAGAPASSRPATTAPSSPPASPPASSPPSGGSGSPGASGLLPVVRLPD